MQPKDRIQRAHDILHFLGTPGAPALFDEQAAIAAHACHDALAWVLGFPCGRVFADNIAQICAELRTLGFQEVDAARPMPEAEARKRELI